LVHAEEEESQKVESAKATAAGGRQGDGIHRRTASVRHVENRPKSVREVRA
jgi:hypothetical protein